MSDRPSTEPGNLEGAVLRAEWEIDALKGRLRDGAKTFASLKAKDDELDGHLRELTGRPLKALVGVIGASALVVLATVWNAAQYPDRDEVDVIHSRQATQDIRLVELGKDIQALSAGLKTERALREIQAELRKLTAPKADPITGRTKPRRRR